MHKFILNLIPICVCIRANDDAILIDAAGFLDTMTEKRAAEAICERGDTKIAKTMAHLHEICFANLVFDA
jgi:hypothetical protein